MIKWTVLGWWWGFQQSLIWTESVPGPIWTKGLRRTLPLCMKFLTWCSMNLLKNKMYLITQMLQQLEITVNSSLEMEILQCSLYSHHCWLNSNTNSEHRRIPSTFLVRILQGFFQYQYIFLLFVYRLSADLTDYIETDDLDIFTLPDQEDYNVSIFWKWDWQY